MVGSLYAGLVLSRQFYVPFLSGKDRLLGSASKYHGNSSSLIGGVDQF